MHLVLWGRLLLPRRRPRVNRKHGAESGRTLKTLKKWLMIPLSMMVFMLQNLQVVLQFLRNLPVKFQIFPLLRQKNQKLIQPLFQPGQPLLEGIGKGQFNMSWILMPDALSSMSGFHLAFGKITLNEHSGPSVLSLKTWRLPSKVSSLTLVLTLPRSNHVLLLPKIQRPRHLQRPRRSPRQLLRSLRVKVVARARGRGRGRGNSAVCREWEYLS